MKQPIRVATICHNEDFCCDPNHRRVRLELHADGDCYRWYVIDEEEVWPQDTLVSAPTITGAIRAASDAWASVGWGNAGWDFDLLPELD